MGLLPVITATPPSPIAAETTSPDLALVPDPELRARAQQRPAVGRTASRVLWQLCAAAQQCCNDPCSLQRLRWLLDQARGIAEAADRAFPEWIPGAVWARDAYRLEAVRVVWRHYRRVRWLRSHELDRMLLETLICADLRRAGLLRTRPSSTFTGNGSHVLKGLALSALVAAALASALSGLDPDAGAATSLHPRELPLLSAASAAVGFTLWEPLSSPRRRRDARAVDALRRCFTAEVTDLGVLGEALRGAVRAGVVWSGETLQVLVRMRMNGPRPATG